MKIGILTEFKELNPGHSLSGVISNQCRMLERFGHEVHLLVAQEYKSNFPEPPNVSIDKVVPRCNQIDYHFEKDLTEEHRVFIDNVLVPFYKQELVKYDVIFTNDLIFTGWLLPYQLGLEKVIQETKQVFFLHFIHSVPPRIEMAQWDWRDIRRLLPNHKLVSFTQHNKGLIQSTYKAQPDDVVVIPHIIDPRVEGDFCQGAWDLIDQMPNILQGDIVCVYPASTDRLRAKQVQVHLALFDSFKRRNMRCALVIANQWATGRDPQEQKDKYIKFGEVLGLHYGVEFIFTSDIKPEYQAGISKKMLRDLHSCANLFVLPSVEEAYCLVGPEAAHTGQYLVANNDVGAFHEIYGDCCHYISFGSMEHSDFYGKSGDYVAEYMDKVSVRVLEGMRNDLAIQAKTRCRIQNNMDAIYLKYYEGVINGER